MSNQLCKTPPISCCSPVLGSDVHNLEGWFNPDHLQQAPRSSRQPLSNTIRCLKDSHQDNSKIRPKKASSGKKLKQQLEDGHKHIGTFGQPSGKFDFIVKYSPPQITPKRVQKQVVDCSTIRTVDPTRR
ncbi:hypothetical protein TIFTF001_017027 [Ficus carica]|uniref:Uncharacterized protein n=1 Tax=Ficus carica TaxID=3494 RepID=A0AA88D6P7_FICCA|nr:hypothetical protein TIFTF001_017027 [Ficus carica]